ncbi:MAG: DUF488 family protein [candidate division WOR-3 bacterium]
MIKLKRIYDKIKKNDGFRILVDRLWPRGVSKEKSKIDLWLKDIAPSDKLRKSFGHKPEKWDEFKKLYKEELKNKIELLKEIKEYERKFGIITLLYSARNEKMNNAIVLKDFLEELKI